MIVYQIMRPDRALRGWIIKGILAGAVISLAVLAWMLYKHNSPEDLRYSFLPAARLALRGGNPYDVAGFLGPPWALLPAILVSWLPDRAAFAVHGIMAVLSVGWFLVVYEIEPRRAIPVLLSVPVIMGVLLGNLEPFLLWALVVPRPAGMLLLAMKPHLGAALGFFWVLDEFRRGGMRAVGRLLLPVALLTGLSFLAYGFWPAKWGSAAQVCGGWGWNLWRKDPWGHVFVLGIPALFYALHREREDIALSAGPLLSPYTCVSGFAVWAPFVATWPPWASWGLCVGLWVLVVAQGF